ncbi:hypothetical protein PRBEI_2001824900 [Prionailurus iriomotensis]
MGSISIVVNEAHSRYGGVRSREVDVSSQGLSLEFCKLTSRPHGDFINDNECGTSLEWSEMFIFNPLSVEGLHVYRSSSHELMNLTLLISGDVPSVQVSDDVGLDQAIRSPSSWGLPYSASKIPAERSR